MNTAVGYARGAVDRSAVLGAWEGTWYLPDGEASLRLDVGAPHEPTKVQVDGRLIASVVDTAAGDGQAALPQASFRGRPRWRFELWRGEHRRALCPRARPL